MNIKKLMLISLIAVAILFSVSVVSAGLLDGLFGGEQQDNVIELDELTFNTTNVTKFKLDNKTDVTGGTITRYFDENDTGYTINIFNCSVDKSTFNDVFNQYKATFDDSPSETIDGIIVYTISADIGDNVGQPRYMSLVQNKDLNTFVQISSPDPNETAKMVLSLKFK